MTGQQEYRITEGTCVNYLVEIKTKDPMESDVEQEVKRNITSAIWNVLDSTVDQKDIRFSVYSRPVHEQQASLKDSNLNEPRIHEDCNFWKIRACKNLTTKNCWNTTCPDHDEYKKRRLPIPTDEQCRICEQAIRKDEREKMVSELFSALECGGIYALAEKLEELRKGGAGNGIRSVSF